LPWGSLVAVRKTTHSAHHAEHVVVHGVDAYLGRAARAHRVHGHRQLEGGLVDAREVAGARRLVLLRLQGKRVHVDALGRGAAVVLERLHAGEVAALALREAVLSVELQLGNLHRVLALAANTRLEDDLREEVVGRVLEHDALVVAARAEVGVEPRRAVERRANTRGTKTGNEVRTRRTVAERSGYAQRGAARHQRAAGQDVHHDALRGEVIRVVERLAAVDLRDEHLVRRAVDERVALDDPHELLDRVVEVELDLVGRRRDRLGTRELELLNQVLVGLLGKAATLLRVQVDVVDVQRRGRERLDADRGRRRRQQLVVRAVDPLLELHVDAHLVVLERDQRDGQSGVAAEPELERDVQRAGRSAGAGGARVRQLRASAGRIQRIAATVLHQHKVVRVADHVVERLDRALVLRQLRPDLHPVAILAVDALAANLELHRLDEAVADEVEPAEAVQLGDRRKVHRRENHLEVRAVHQVRVTVDDGRHALVEVGLAVERHLNGLHREVGMTLVQDLPERDLGGARDVDILRTIADELKKTTTHIDCLIERNIIFAGEGDAPMSNGVALEVGVFLSCLVCLGSAATATAAATTTTLPTLHFPKHVPNRRTLSSRDRVQLLLLILEVLCIGCRGQVASTPFPSVSTHCF